jgi:hypothetical protein
MKGKFVMLGSEVGVGLRLFERYEDKKPMGMLVSAGPWASDSSVHATALT